MSKRPFVPSFLQKVDDKLLRNKPGTWAARTHLVLYFSAVFALLLVVFCYVVFFDAKQYSNIGSWNTIVGLIAFVGFVFWLIYLLRFNVFKSYGNWSAMDGLKDFALYFTSIALMVAVCFIPSAVETWRANQQFGNEEIVKDINELNVNSCRLEYNLLPLEWRVDTCQVINRINNMQSSDDAVTVPSKVLKFHSTSVIGICAILKPILECTGLTDQVDCAIVVVLTKVKIKIELFHIIEHKVKRLIEVDHYVIGKN